MKRYIIYSVICVLFLLLGILVKNEFTLFSLFVIPFSFVGDGLRSLSISSGIGNFFAIILYILVILTPIYFLIYRYIKKSVSFGEVTLLILLSYVLGRTLYDFINPHILYNMLGNFLIYSVPITHLPQFELILTSGRAYIFYAMLLIVLVYYVYKSDNKKSIHYFKIIIDGVILILSFSILTVGNSSLIRLTEMTNVVVEQDVIVFKSIFNLVINGFLIYMLELFRKFVIDLDTNGIHHKMIDDLNKIYKYSFIQLILILTSQIIINAYQFQVLSELSNINFELDIPIFSILVVTVIFIFTKHFKNIVEMKKENDLFI